MIDTYMVVLCDDGWAVLWASRLMPAAWMFLARNLDSKELADAWVKTLETDSQGKPGVTQ